MLSWSNACYKFTIGVGTLALAGMLSEVARPALSAWAAVAVVMVPLVAFVFVHPGELPPGVVRTVHVAASVYYFALAFGLLAATLSLRPQPHGWPVYPLFTAVGAVPCAIVLGRAVAGRYESH